MRVAMQVLMALTASLALLSGLVHLTGTADAITQGLDSAPSSTHLMLRLEAAPPSSSASPPEDPALSQVLQQVYAAFGENIQENDRSDGSVSLKIAYEGKDVEEGAYVPMLKASSAPTVTVSDTKGSSGVYYAWILIDVDAPKPEEPSHAPFLHYIVANLDPSGTQPPLTVVSYYPVSPPEGTHRYVGLLYKQIELFDESDARHLEHKLGKKRVLFDVSKFADKQDLAYVKRSYFYSSPAHPSSG